MTDFCATCFCCDTFKAARMYDFASGLFDVHSFFPPVETLIYWRRYIFKHLLCEEMEIFSGYERCGFGLSGKIECPPPTNQSPTLDILSLGWTVALLCCSVKLVLGFVLFRHQVNMTG